MRTPRVGIIGCGRMGLERAGACREFGASVSLVFDSNPDRASALAKEFGAGISGDPLELVSANIDALFVCIPPSGRGDIETAAVAKNIPLFVEKPVGLSVEQCNPILDLLRSRDTITAVGYMNRYRQSIRQARDEIMGASVLGASCVWFGTPYQVQWWHSPEHSGGAINEQATHLVDLARYLLGEIKEVHAFWVGDTKGNGAIGSASMTLRMETDVLCSILYGCTATKKMIGLEVFMPDRVLRLEGWDFHRVDASHPRGAEENKNQIFRKETAAFLNAVLTGKREEIRSDFEDACRTQSAVDAILRSLTSGKNEKVSYRSIPLHARKGNSD